MTVSNLDQSEQFYEQVLHFGRGPETAIDGEAHATLEAIPGARTRRVQMDLGSECVELSEPLGGVRRPIPPDSQSNDRWFQHIAIVVSDMDRAYAWLEANHVAHVSVAPQRLPEWNKAAANIRAYYFKDPDGHTLEAIWFPADKGQPRWHPPPGGPIFIGIDHTAIAVADTEASIGFYVRKLAFHVAGTSENWGPEQERLNNVPSAHLRITTLRTDQGPGVELLEYVSPRTGRPMPADERSDDLIHWRTTLFADGARSAHTSHDPDGHAMEIHPR